MQVPKKIRNLSMAYYMFGAIGMIGFAGLGALDFVMYAIEQRDPIAASDPSLLAFVQVVKGLIIFMTILHVVVNVFIGWALQNGRFHSLCTVTGYVMLLSLPFGTILGLLTIIWLKEPEVQRAFSS